MDMAHWRRRGETVRHHGDLLPKDREVIRDGLITLGDGAAEGDVDIKRGCGLGRKRSEPAPIGFSLDRVGKLGRCGIACIARKALLSISLP
jgi:hypothetical protein